MIQKSRTHPLVVLIVFIAAAHLVIGVFPGFVPMTDHFDRIEPALCKVIGSGLMLGLTWWFVLRDPPSRAMLDLGPSVRNFGILLGWTIVGSGIVVIWLLTLGGLVPLRLEPGTMTAAGFTFSVVVYLFGSIIEELAFRGYPFLRLRRSYGVVTAIAIASIAFGLFHFPGMSGVALLKIVAITALCSVIFCLGFLRTGTLWAAIGLHAGVNITMHSIFGAGDPNRASLLRVVSEGPSTGWDIWFWSFILVGTIAAALIALARREFSNEAVCKVRS